MYTSFFISRLGEATFFTTAEKKGRQGCVRYIIYGDLAVVFPSNNMLSACLVGHTEMTFRRPSSTSLSWRLSSSFLIWEAGMLFCELREFLADWAASMVRSRAGNSR